MRFIKSIDHLQLEASESGENTLKRTFGPVNLIALGVAYYMISGSLFIVGIPLGMLALITLLSAAFGYSE